MSNTLQHIFKRYPELKEILSLIRYEIQQAQRPADEVILDDQDVMRHLKISRRKLQYLKAYGIIPIHYLEPDKPRTYYLLSDILYILKENRIESFTNTKKIK